MVKQESTEEVKHWRWNYWQRRKKYQNREMAEKLGVNAANLSALGKGTVNKKTGKRKNPGPKFIKDFYMIYPDLKDLPPEDEPGGSDANEGQQNYKEDDRPPHSAEEDKEQYTDSEKEFLRAEFRKMNSTNQKAVDAVYKLAESTLVLSQEVAFYRKKTNS
jgi:hypothetical protein